MVEFCLPHDINLDGVEFKSMASGSHRITSDFMYVLPADSHQSRNFQSVEEHSLSLCVYSPSSLFCPLARYFRKGSYFGLACFANMPVESELERGARMKSVGILCPSYTLLYRYMHFLENQVRLDMAVCRVCVCACVRVSLTLSPVHHPIYILFTLFICDTTLLRVSLSCAYLLFLLLCSNVFSHLLNMNPESQLQLPSQEPVYMRLLY